MAFAGYLIKLGGSDGTELPLDYMRVESYSAITKHTEHSNLRSVTGYGYRLLAVHPYAQVSFQSKPMNSAALATLNALITGAMSDTTNREITIEYFDPETDTYKEANCYMPDVEFAIRTVESPESVIFSPATYTFIEH